MTYENALVIIGAQNKNLRKIDNVRFTHNGYEYRITYQGGFGCYVAIDRRQIGKRNFKYFAGIGAYHCMTCGQAMELVKQKVFG